MTSRDVQDRAVQFEAEGQPIAGMLHLPTGESRAVGVVFCNAFGDERKSSCLTMVRLARAVASRGLAVLRFDYRGCGDSPGPFVDASVSTRLADIRSAAAFLKSEAGVESAFLLGLRLGATLAARVADGIADCAGLVLIEPILDGAAYFDTLMKRKRVRGMMTAGKDQSGAAEHGEDVIDLDGYAVRPRTLEELRDLRIGGDEAAFCGRVRIVQVSFSEKLQQGTLAARDAYGAGGAEVSVEALVMPPFWSRIDITDTTSLQEAVAAWLEEVTGPGGQHQSPAAPDR